HQRQFQVGELQHRPGVVLVADAAVERLGVPLDGALDVLHRNGNMVDRVERSRGRGHSLVPRQDESSSLHYTVLRSRFRALCPRSRLMSRRIPPPGLVGVRLAAFVCTVAGLSLLAARADDGPDDRAGKRAEWAYEKTATVELGGGVRMEFVLIL